MVLALDPVEHGMEAAAGAKAAPPFHNSLSASALVLCQGDLGLEGAERLAEATDDVALGLIQTQGEEFLIVGVTKVAVGSKDEVIFARTVDAKVQDFFRVVVEHGPTKARAPWHVSLTGARGGALNGGQEIAEEAERSAGELRKETIGDEVIIDVGAVVVPCAEKPPEVTVQVVNTLSRRVAATAAVLFWVRQGCWSRRR